MYLKRKDYVDQECNKICVTLSPLSTKLSSLLLMILSYNSTSLCARSFKKFPFSIVMVILYISFF